MRRSSEAWVRFGVALAGALLVGLSHVTAHASELSWDGPAECAERESLSFQIERAVGAPLERLGNLTFHVRVESSPTASSARLRMTSDALQSSPKERVIVAASCSKLVDTLAVAIALALDDAREAPPPNASEPAAEAPLRELAAPHAATIADVAPAAEQTIAAGLRPSAFALLVGDVGALPSPAIGVALGAQLSGTTWHVRASGTLFLEQQARAGAGAGGDLGLAFGTLMACGEPLARAHFAIAPALCAGFDVGRMSGVGRGVATARERAVVWLSPRLDAGLSWRAPNTQLGLNALVGVAAPLNRDAFILDDIGTVHRPGSVVARAAIGVELLF